MEHHADGAIQPTSRGVKKPASIFAVFDSHTPYLAFRLNALQAAIEARGLSDLLQLQVVLIGAEEQSYGWEGQNLRDLYRAPLHVLSPAFRGLGLKTFLHPSVPKCLSKMLGLLLKHRPKIAFVGGYDRPESMLATLLARFWGGKVGVWNDSKFNDSECFSRSVWLEWIKSFMVARYSFFLCPGRESADYHHFLGGRKKPAWTAAWDVVDNESIGRAAGDPGKDAEVRRALDVPESSEFFLMPVRFVEKKNVMRTLEAFARYAKRAGASAKRLVICGKGPLESAMRERVQQGGLESFVRIVPWLPYELVPRACRLARAVVLPSTHDQWGMIVNEALAAGAPVLVSNRCGAHELVKNHRNGFTFDPFDVAQLAYLFGVMSADDSLVAAMRRDAAESVRGFSIEQWLEAHFAALEHYGLIPKTNRLGHNSIYSSHENSPNHQPIPS